jgi:phosphatidyl-myo-inositol dimannoside synthase
MRVLFATLNFPPAHGGIEQLCAQVAGELTALGETLHVLAPGHAGAADFDAGTGYAVSRYRSDFWRHAQLGRAVHAELARHPDSVVLFAQWTAAGVAMLSPRVRAARMFTFAHAKELVRPERGLRAGAPFDLYRRGVLSRLAGVLAVSRYSAEHARIAGARSVHVVHPGVDAARFALPAAEAEQAAEAQRAAEATAGPILLTVARLVPRKGIDTMIAALPELARSFPGVRYRVVGAGPDRARLLALAVEHGVRERVELAGAAEPRQLPAIYAAADLFVLASREEPERGDVEGFGMVLLEAQAAGTAVVAAQSGGMPDALLPGETGVLVPPRDPAALARAIGELLADRPRLQAMRAAARRYAQGRTWRRVAAEVQRILAGGTETEHS